MGSVVTNIMVKPYDPDVDNIEPDQMDST